MSNPILVNPQVLKQYATIDVKMSNEQIISMTRVSQETTLRDFLGEEKFKTVINFAKDPVLDPLFEQILPTLQALLSFYTVVAIYSTYINKDNYDVFKTKLTYFTSLISTQERLFKQVSNDTNIFGDRDEDLALNKENKPKLAPFIFPADYE